MDSLQVVPPIKQLREVYNATPDYMVPTMNPHAVILEKAIPAEVCDNIVSQYRNLQGYRFPACGGETREIPRPVDDIFEPIRSFINYANKTFWNYDLIDEPAIWMQTYRQGDDYRIHMDGSPGQSRKLTAVVMLTESFSYDGGQLRLVPYPEAYDIPKEKGTIVVFPSWILHDVSVVERGLRQTLNIGYWGPAFR